jgi:biotin synthase-related radical SAM superfamily protein
MNNKPKRGTIVASMWKRGSFKYASSKIDSKIFDAIQRVELGDGELVLENVHPETIKSKQEAGQKRPVEAYLKYYTAEEVAAEREEYQARKNNGGL